MFGPIPWRGIAGCIVCLLVAAALFADLGCSTSAPC